MLLSSLSLLFLPITLAAKSTCLPSGDENAINQAFAAGEHVRGATSAAFIVLVVKK